ncbi:MAG: hypothetical protein Q8K32_29805 [Archangium sp.]|nr:hypothetical protein [Archangium sp.]
MDPTKASLLAALMLLGLWLVAQGQGARATPLILRHEPPRPVAPQQPVEHATQGATR